VRRDVTSTILFRVQNQHLEIGETGYDSLLLNGQCLSHSESNVVLCSGPLQYLLILHGLFLRALQDLISLLIDDLHATVYELIFKLGDAALQIKVQVCVNLNEHLGD
jgi:hypothetical protein